MYLRRHGRKKGGCEYESWTLVESVRTSQGPRQRVVATLGKLPGMEKEERIGWEEIARILDGRARPEPSLFEKEQETPAWVEVNLKGVSVERLRHFGEVYLGLALWKRLGLSAFCQTHIPAGREEIAWPVMAAVLVLARFCAPSWRAAESRGPDLIYCFLMRFSIKLRAREVDREESVGLPPAGLEPFCPGLKVSAYVLKPIKARPPGSCCSHMSRKNRRTAEILFPGGRMRFWTRRPTF